MAQDKSDLIHLPCPKQIHIRVFERHDRSYKRRISLHQSMTATDGIQECVLSESTHSAEHRHASRACDIAPFDHYPLNADSNDFCHIKVKEMPNVVHLTNLSAAKWNEAKIRASLSQINPYWSKHTIHIYLLQNYKTGLLTASIEFQSREYSEKAMHLIQSNFHLFVNVPRTLCTQSQLLRKRTARHLVTGIKLKFFKPNICSSIVFTKCAPTSIPLGFDVRCIVQHHYHLHCAVPTKLTYFHNTRILDHVPAVGEIDEFVAHCRLPPRQKWPENDERKHTILLSVYLPLLSLAITHEQHRFYCYATMTELSMYRFDDALNQYRLHASKRVSQPLLVCNLLYLDILQLLETNASATTQLAYTFYDANNQFFECDLYRKVAHDLGSNEIAPLYLKTLKLSFGDADLDRCCICLSENRCEEFARLSSCRHIFHFQCIKQLLAHQRAVINRPVWDRSSHGYVLCNFGHCPLCRRPFTSIQSRIVNSAAQPPTVQIISVSDIDLICDDDDVEDAEDEEEDEDDVFDDDDQASEEDDEDDEDGVVHVDDYSEVADSSAINGYQHFDELQNVPLHDENDFGEYDELATIQAAIDEEEELEATEEDEDEDEFSEATSTYVYNDL